MLLQLIITREFEPSQQHVSSSPMLCKRGLRRRLTPEITRTIPRASLWTCAQCRSYAGTSTVRGKRPHPTNATHNTRTYASVTRLPSTALGTVTTNAPSQTTIEQLLEPLQTARSYPADNIPSSSTHARLSILVTPSFAQHALDQQLPLRAYEILRANKHGLKTIETVTAVVDRLPAVTTVLEQPPIVREEQLEGQEGLAYFFTPEEKTELEPTGEQLAPQQPVIGFRGKLATPFQGKPGTLTFSMPGNSSPLVPNHTVELPLAQTIFSTQRVSTLIRTIYIVDDEKRLHVQAHQEPRSLNLNLPTRSNGNSWRIQLPLLPLTPARQVKYSMGNILRQLWHTTDSTSGQGSSEATPQPASQELEAAVSSYFDTIGLDAQAVAVWALIVPKTRSPLQDNKATRRLLQMQSDEMRKSWLQRGGRYAHPDLQRGINSGILGAIHHGAKLCKVLSGGGGWGKKAGLLSLDPDNSYDVAGPGNLQSNTAKIPNMDWKPFDEDMPSAFGQIAEVGDLVMFFLAPAGLDGGKIRKVVLKRPLQTEPVADVDDTLETNPAFVFGALPSSIDTVPATTSPSTEVKITHTPSVFGMLSEGGMALELSSPPGARLSSDAIRTKLDVPFARFNGTKGPRVVVRKPVDKVLQGDVQTPEWNHHVLENQTASARRKSTRFYARGQPRFVPAGSIDQRYRFAVAQSGTGRKSRTEPRKGLDTSDAAHPSQNSPFSESCTQRSMRSLRKQSLRNRIYGQMTRSTIRVPKGLSLVRTYPIGPPTGVPRIRAVRIRRRKELGNLDYIDSPERFRALQRYEARQRTKPAEADVFNLMTRSEVYGPAAASGDKVVGGVSEDLKRGLVEDVEGLFWRGNGDGDGKMKVSTPFGAGEESKEDSAAVFDRLVKSTEPQGTESKDGTTKDAESKTTFTPF